MGQAIQRADGTYRSWARVGDPGRLHEGETLVEMAECPEITTPAQGPPQYRAALEAPVTRALITQIARLRGVPVETIIEEAVVDAALIAAADLQAVAAKAGG